jgi:hypothetical protein
MSAPSAEPAASPSIAAYWVKNNVLAAVLAAIASFLLYLIRQAVGTTAPDAGFTAALFMYMVAVAVWGLYGAANGVLTGAVLQRITPRLPVWAWIALHVAGAVLIGLAGEVSQVNSLRATAPAPAENDTLLATLVMGAIAGAILGAISGGCEALILRRAATGTSAWIAWSAIATAAGWCVLSLGVKAWDMGADLPGELASEMLSFVANVLMALLTLPALRRLRSIGLAEAPRFFT